MSVSHDATRPKPNFASGFGTPWAASLAPCEVKPPTFSTPAPTLASSRGMYSPRIAATLLWAMMISWTWMFSAWFRSSASAIRPRRSGSAKNASHCRCAATLGPAAASTRPNDAGTSVCASLALLLPSTFVQPSASERAHVAVAATT